MFAAPIPRKQQIAARPRRVAGQKPPASSWLAALPEDLRAIETCWREKLSDLQFKVLRMKATEDIHTGEYNEHFEVGKYVCSGCEQPLYDSEHKFRSGHGWPAFSDNYEGALTRYGKGKVEITCSGCGAHVGHVFKSSYRSWA